MSSRVKKYTPEWWAGLPPERVGKETEKMVEALFIEWNNSTNFAWHRLPDAKSARGMLRAQPADYIYRSPTGSGFIEVKALKHPYRLPSERVSQLPTLKKWALAGSQDIILVHHYMIGQWRIMCPEDIECGVPSWDLSRIETHPTAKDALLKTLFF